jgi:hypothetical protein
MAVISYRQMQRGRAGSVQVMAPECFSSGEESGASRRLLRTMLGKTVPRNVWECMQEAYSFIDSSDEV